MSAGIFLSATLQLTPKPFRAERERRVKEETLKAFLFFLHSPQHIPGDNKSGEGSAFWFVV